MEFEWDARKAASNLRKHGIDFADAATVLYDELAVTVVDEERSEERFVTTGIDALGQLLVVVYTWRGKRVRMISARRATPLERQQYEGGV
ncbi:MAG: BrnT family toxin [candidate division NC10 bacterium]|nr:BrnT family toxin [candidate division NC10 bacterium]